MILFYSFLKVVFYTVICYAILFIAGIPFILIPDSYYPNILGSILIKESLFLISGLIIIFFSKYFSIYTNINFRISKTLLYYLLTIFITLVFCYILYLSGIIDVNLNEISSFSSFAGFLIYCTIPTFFTGFGEEIIFRWFLINRLRIFINANLTIVISSLIFCLGHNWNLPNLLFAFTGGCLFGLIYIRTNSVFNCIGIHSAWNFGQRFFFEGMSEFTYKAQRLLLFEINDLSLYNWYEFIFCLLILSTYMIYFQKDKKEFNFAKG